jgi:hypothetical protein
MAGIYRLGHRSTGERCVRWRVMFVQRSRCCIRAGSSTET